MEGMQSCDVAIIGGGPSAAAAGRLLATWGRSTCILGKPPDRSRGLAESIPPSTRKLLATVGVVEAVERRRFYATSGNTVWWGSDEARVESFGHGETGFQVFRPDFDDLLLDEAAAGGADVRRAAIVRAVDVGEDFVTVSGAHGSDPLRLRCQFVLDCSGRAGVLAKAYRRIEPSYRMCAMVGTWCRPDGWDVPDETHTLVETCEDGWVWSVPLSRSVRQIGVMVDGIASRAGAAGLTASYRAELTSARHLAPLAGSATLQHTWACDAGLYSSDCYAGRRFLLVGDAGSFIDPLSSFGIKKALASAWLAAIVANTCLIDPARQPAAADFFSRREQDVYRTHLRRSSEFARVAHAHHPHPFWARRAERGGKEIEEANEDDLLRSPAVQEALEALRRSPRFAFTLRDDLRIDKQPVVRGREIVLEDAIALPRRADPSSAADERGRERTIRFLNNVDLLSLARIAATHTQVPAVVETYCRAHGRIPLPDLLGALSFLIASGILSSGCTADSTGNPAFTAVPARLKV